MHKIKEWRTRGGKERKWYFNKVESVITTVMEEEGEDPDVDHYKLEFKIGGYTVESPTEFSTMRAAKLSSDRFASKLTDPFIMRKI